MMRKCIILATVVILFACGGNDVDVTPPTMEVIDYTPTPTQGEICGTQENMVFSLRGGQELAFDVIFSDNEALSQYKVDVHNNFDCHGHGGGSAPSIAVPNVDNLTEDWSILDIQDITGTSSMVRRSFTVPENVTAGNYHYHIQVVDESGNDNPAANFFSLRILNPLDSVAPVISIAQPSSASFSAKKGEVVRFVGKVNDDRSLSDGGNGIVYLAYTKLSTGNTFSTDVAFAFDETVDTSYDFDFEFTIPQTWTPGKYRLSVGANDGVRNVAPFQFFEVDVDN